MNIMRYSNPVNNLRPPLRLSKGHETFSSLRTTVLEEPACYNPQTGKSSISTLPQPVLLRSDQFQKHPPVSNSISHNIIELPAQQPLAQAPNIEKQRILHIFNFLQRTMEPCPGPFSASTRT
jgi:hypothetical protein